MSNVAAPDMAAPREIGSFGSLLRAIWDPSPAPEPNLLHKFTIRGRKCDDSATATARARWGPVLGICALSILLAGLVLRLPEPALRGEGLVAILGLLTV